MVRKFEDLRIWQDGMDLVEEIFGVTSNFPKSEIYGLTNQIRRAVISVPSNIAEGCGKNTKKDFVRYLYNSLGSIKEVKCQLIIARRLNFLDKDSGEKIIDESDRLAGMLMKFIKKVSSEDSKYEA
jgi:four helix bundle protein